MAGIAGRWRAAATRAGPAAAPGCRATRTVRDYERLPEHHETIVYWAMVITMTRRLARRSQPAQPRDA
jgi:hypothetical protein